MSQITTEQLKQLRDETGVSVMQCKKALEEAGGDMEKAVLILKKKSSDIAAKKADREAHDGIVVVKKDAGKVAVLVLNCETDFVASNSDFIALGDALVSVALSEGKESLESKAKDLIDPVIQKIGENIQLSSIDIIEGAVIGAYIHNNKTATIITLSGGDEALAKDIAMHATAMKPEFISRNEINADVQEKVKELFKEEVAASGKPQDIQEKMLEGKLGTYFKERTLIDQSFVKNPDITVGQLLDQSKAQITHFFTKSV
ncbi:MAG: translation elongation factor Ts [Candidatus Pacebacteria bacterium]|nr:translation elongation factor Ts [Candidatus Paceibacterota bacterium]